MQNSTTIATYDIKPTRWINMEKKFWKSKTFWASLLIAGGVLGKWLTGDMPLQEAIMGVGGALGLFGVRDALK